MSKDQCKCRFELEHVLMMRMYPKAFQSKITVLIKCPLVLEYKDKNMCIYTDNQTALKSLDLGQS